MRSKINIVIVVIMLLLPLYGHQTHIRAASIEPMELIVPLVPITKEVPKTKRKSFKPKSFEHFLWALAQRESGNDWKVYNKWGYMGKYQFGKLALEDLGYGNCVTFEEFKVNPDVFPEWLQDELIVTYIKKNKRNLGRYIRNYDNCIIDSVEITESGIIAAAHLVGSGNTTKWFDNCGEIDIKDGNGVSIKEYMKTFSGYEID